MKKLVTLQFITLHNAAHFFFFTKWRSEILNAGMEVQDALVELMPRFLELYELEKSEMEWVRKSEYTAQIADAKRLLDTALSGLKAHVRAALHAFDPSVADAAKRITIMLRNYGNVAKKPYLEELGTVQAILENLTEAYAPDVAKTGVSEWVADLQKNFELFNRLYNLRNEQSVKKPPVKFKEVRRKIDALYRAMAAKVNAGATVGASTDFAAFIDCINPEIDRLNTEFHKGRLDIGAGDNCMVEAIDTQPYSGSPVTPLPKAHFRQDGKPTKELVFSKDFSITYRNNREPGTANLILHGKGRYRGQKMVTFHIERGELSVKY